ncbi:MAG: S8 family serine peptidase [Candidatus Thermoplasmatota archaeon]|nr:S8 family serine peptidase [Candidatus Thermoplasmatota archaeon]
MKRSFYPALCMVVLLLFPMVGSLSCPPKYLSVDGSYVQFTKSEWTSEIPIQMEPDWVELPWWERTSLDSNRNSIHDSLEDKTGVVWVGLSYSRAVTSEDISSIMSIGIEPKIQIPAVDAVLLGAIDSSNLLELSNLDGVVMIEEYGTLRFYGDIQTPAVKASSSDIYPEGAWNLSVSGAGINIALTDTGVDSEHPGLVGKHVAGYDAVCFVHSDPTCILAGGRQTDGSFDPDDGNQHGTACMGMAAATGIEADGSQSEFYGSAPNSTLVDVRIGTDVGAGPFENYLLEQEFYESAMNGIQWIIDNKDTAWPGVDESLSGIDIISLSWGITSHEGGGSDGEDMHSRILNEATLAGVTVSVAAGNDGPDNEGLSGMGSSSLSITVGATDDQNTIDRTDDTVAGYSSRGPRSDNGDGNPINELKPDISAPGSNIIQAEGCVSSGGCNNNIPGQDASENTYTGRGSGTSYATPAVTGVIALVMEANPDLDPLQIREVLKQTAERRGDPTQPDVDPYWNRDFGWGMVDARAAVELAFHLSDTNQSNDIDWTVQNHLLNISEEGVMTIIIGHSWGIEGSIDSVQFRVDNGDWFETMYEVSPSELGALTPFNWTLALDRSSLSSGEHLVEIRALSSSGNSLPVIVSIDGTGAGESTAGLSAYLSSIAVVLFFAIAAGSVIILSKRGEDDDEEILDAEIVPPLDLDSHTVAELKEMCIKEGLSRSGNKSELIERLRSQPKSR